jgi:hypothetical protein
MNACLTIIVRDLPEKNHDVMKKAFLTIVVKIPVPIFTISTRFVALLRLMSARIRVSAHVSQCSRVNHAA